MKHSDAVGSHFESEWVEYDDDIRRAIPYYDDLLGIIVSIVRESVPEVRRALDLGVGTGNLAARFLGEFELCHLTGVDIVPSFVQAAAAKLAAYDDRLTLVHADVCDLELEGPFDVIMTSLMFHHLTDDHKADIYRRSFESLRPGGLLLNADMVGSASPFYGDAFDRLRIQFMRSQGLSEGEIQVRYVEHRKLEIPAPVNRQLQWLTEIGFVDTECHWKYLNLALFGGRRAGPV